jgi:hypothetical protein
MVLDQLLLAMLISRERSCTLQVLDAAGLERGRQPVWQARNAEQFWREVSALVACGILADGRRRILAQARRQRPANPAFAAGRPRLCRVAGKAQGAPAARCRRRSPIESTMWCWCRRSRPLRLAILAAVCWLRDGGTNTMSQASHDTPDVAVLIVQYACGTNIATASVTATRPPGGAGRDSATGHGWSRAA